MSKRAEVEPIPIHTFDPTQADCAVCQIAASPIENLGSSLPAGTSTAAEAQATVAPADVSKAGILSISPEESARWSR